MNFLEIVSHMDGNAVTLESVKSAVNNWKLLHFYELHPKKEEVGYNGLLPIQMGYFSVFLFLFFLFSVFSLVVP